MTRTMDPTVSFEETFGPAHLRIACVAHGYDGPECPVGLGANKDEALASLVEQLDDGAIDGLIEWELFRRVSRLGSSCNLSILEAETRARAEVAR